MKAEHRHELSTNELADWIGNFPNFIKKNIRPIIGIALILLGLSLWLTHKTRKTSAEDKSQIAISERIVGLNRAKFQIIYSNSQGMDISPLLIQNAQALEMEIEKVKDNANLIALTLIKNAQARRADLHYQPRIVDPRDVKSQIEHAQNLYQQALDYSAENPTLTAMAKFGLGLCAEELGDFDAAKQIYSELTQNEDYSSTVSSYQAKIRLEIIDDYKADVKFAKAPPKPQPEESSVFDIPGVDEISFAETEINLPSTPDVNKQ